MAQRIFTDNILTSTGQVKFPKGAVRDFRRDTWERLASSAGKSLDSFTEPTREAIDVERARVLELNPHRRKDPVGQKRQRPRLKKEIN